MRFTLNSASGRLENMSGGLFIRLRVWNPCSKTKYPLILNIRNNKKEEKKQLKKQSPLFSAEKIDDPLLVIQGANDPRVKKQESDQIVVAARENNVDVKYLVAENEGHGFRQQNNRLAVAAAMEKFFAQHLGGRYQKSVDDNIQKRWDELNRDVNEVTMPDTTGKAEKEKAFPILDGERMKSHGATYGQTIKAGDRTMQMEMSRRVKPGETEGQKAWLVTTTSRLLLAIATADCAPVLLSDPVAGVIGACHAGWRGAVAGIAARTVQTMVERGARPSSLRAHVGPCLSREAFEVGPEVAAQFDAAVVHRREAWPRPHVDLKAAVRRQLSDAGLADDHIEASAHCTLQEDDTFFSHRASGGTTGRMFGAIVLRP